MAGNKKKGKAAAAPAPSNATAAPARSSPAHDTCNALIAAIQQLLASKGSALLAGPLVEAFSHKLEAVYALKWVSAGVLRQKSINEPGQIIHLINIAGLLTQLLLKLLAARKRPRDWKQEEYSNALCKSLTAASTFFQVPVFSKGVVESSNGTAINIGQLERSYGPLGRVEVMRLTAAAQEEVCQLMQAALKQKQQQQQQGQQQPGQQSAPQVLPLCRLAKCLLVWWMCIDLPWSAGDAHKRGAQLEAIDSQNPAMQLAAVLAQSAAPILGAESPISDYNSIVCALAELAGR
jgi:hypothetical protein